MVVCVEERADGGDAGVRRDDVQAAVTLDACGHGTPDIVAPCDVAADRDAAEFGGCLLGGVDVEVEQDDLRALRDEARGDGPADPWAPPVTRADVPSKRVMFEGRRRRVAAGEARMPEAATAFSAVMLALFGDLLSCS